MKSAVIIVEKSAHEDKNLRLPATGFYRLIEKMLKLQGYSVKFDSGRKGTVPSETAKLWIGHGSGCERFKFAPRNVRTIRIFGQSADSSDLLHYILSKHDLDALLLGARCKPEVYQGTQPEDLIERAVNRLQACQTFTTYLKAVEDALKQGAELPEFPQNFSIIDSGSYLPLFLFMLYHGPVEYRYTAFSGLKKFWESNSNASSWRFSSELMPVFRRLILKADTKFGHFLKSVTHFDSLFADSRTRKSNVWTAMFNGLDFDDVPKCFPVNYTQLLVELADKLSKLDAVTVVDAWYKISDRYCMFNWQFCRG